MLETLAFTLLIGGQFLAAVYLISYRAEVYMETVSKPEAEVAAGAIGATQS